MPSGGLAVADSKHPLIADFFASLTHGMTTGILTGGLHARHGDWVMCMRFWREITREGADLCASAFGARLSRQSPVTRPNHHASS
ncbi:MAG: hypothetical protein A2496_17210 [Burkholderiales bacterium RIFOXYC12_FULL_60_6]|nr:MAG: hypothetical protein A2496_17210 [Burkholderiales bacterium RIFOXYC12_FULL_60_6]